MRILVIILAGIVILFGLRLVLTALKTVFKGQILVRQGIRTQWQPVSDRSESWKAAFRDGLMGVLLIILGGVLIF